MNEQIKQFIENNIDLIENNDFEKLFINAPDGLGAILQECDISFLYYMNTIPDGCFRKSFITHIDIPDTIKVIGDSAFAFCYNLEVVEFPDKLISILQDAFTGCSRLRSVILPEGLDYVGPYSFYSTSLNYLQIPSSVSLIDAYAFSNCSSDILQIKYNGTKANWKRISTGLDAFKDTYYTCTCLDGVVEKKRRNR